jgi:hypothetical protein
MPGRRYRLQVRDAIPGGEWIDFIDRLTSPSIWVDTPGVTGLFRVMVELE